MLYANNKGADQAWHMCSIISSFVIWKVQLPHVQNFNFLVCPCGRASWFEHDLGRQAFSPWGHINSIAVFYVVKVCNPTVWSIQWWFYFRILWTNCKKKMACWKRNWGNKVIIILYSFPLISCGFYTEHVKAVELPLPTRNISYFIIPRLYGYKLCWVNSHFICKIYYFRVLIRWIVLKHV